MTRFLMSLDQAVDTIFAALRGACPGEIYVPRVPGARIADVARALVGERNVEIRVTGIRPGEKMHEILVSEEEGARTVARDAWMALRPMLPELLERCGEGDFTPVPLEGREYSSADDLLDQEGVRTLLARHHLRLEDLEPHMKGELLR